MSEVNKAFLRAYLKNRAAESSQTFPASTTVDSRPHQSPTAARPSSSVPRQPVPPPTQPAQSLPSGMNLRFDPAHAEQNEQARTQPGVGLPHTTPAGGPSPQERVAPRQGVWSPLGAERGMKALERQSTPAIVRNGVIAITNEATQFRRPSAPVEQSPQIVQKSHPKSPPESPQRTASTNSPYDQVMFVDGLAGHTPSQRMPGSRPADRTLAEIAEPIAFGTGQSSTATTPNRVQPKQTPSNSSPPLETRTRPIGPGVTGARDSKPATFPGPMQTGPAIQKEVHQTFRIDAAHLRSEEKVASAPTLPKSKPPTAINPLPLPVAFCPSWEVDQFFWPEVVKHIEKSDAEAFAQIGKHLSLANRDGLRIMAITSGERGVGRSTVAMHMARCAASAGLRVALVDGDTYCPSLIDQLRLDMQQGWQDCLFENVPMQDIAVNSIADRITLFPLTSVISPQQVHANLHRIAKLVRRIANAFDMVFIDGSRINLEQRDLVGVAQESVVDAAIVVTDTELSIKEKVDSAVSILQEMRISSIGLVENFQS